MLGLCKDNSRKKRVSAPLRFQLREDGDKISGKTLCALFAYVKYLVRNYSLKLRERERERERESSIHALVL